MNKLKIKLVAISLLVISTIAVAEDTQTDISKFGLNWNTIPVLCGNAEQLDRYLKEYNFELEMQVLVERMLKKMGNLCMV